MNKIFVILISSMVPFVALFSADVKADLNGKLPQIDYILIEKSKRTMVVYHVKEILKKYKIALGGSPKVHKERQGDCKTPEGLYAINGKNINSRYRKALKISYPNDQDKKHCAKIGCSTGNDVMIHGLHNSDSWLGRLHRLRDRTLGCIAVTDEEIDEIFAATPVGTQVEIKP